jgi:hypothetical protein
MTAGLCWLALAGAASAATVTLTPGPADPQYFASKAAGQNNFTLDGITWTLVSGSAATEKGSVVSQYAAPLGMGTSTATGTTYFAVPKNSVEQATWTTPQTSLKIYWGSIDASNVDDIVNQISIEVDGFTLTGSDLVALGALGNGNQFSTKSDQWVTITGLAPFTTVDFSDSSNRNAFEFSLNTPALGQAGGTPEPSTWAMMVIGFAGLGYAAFRRNPKKGQMAIGAI